MSCTWRAPYIHEFPSYSLGGILCLLIGVRTLRLLRSRPDMPPIHMPGDQHRFLFMISIPPAFRYILKSPWVGNNSQNAGPDSATSCLVLGPLFWECPHPRALPYTYWKQASLGKSVLVSYLIACSLISLFDQLWKFGSRFAKLSPFTFFLLAETQSSHLHFLLTFSSPPHFSRLTDQQ